MKYALPLLGWPALVVFCRTHIGSHRITNPAVAVRQKAIDEIRETDQNFNWLSQKQDIAKAFMT